MVTLNAEPVVVPEDDPVRVCSQPGCPRLVKAGAYRGLCDEHRKARDKARGTRQQRGYGAEHQRFRAKYVQAIKDGQTVLCWRCGQPIKDPDDLHLGHDDNDRSITRGPEHSRRCNLSAAGRASHRS
jgi:hypothetical protein